MAKRFSRYEFALKAASKDGTGEVTFEDGSPLDKYQDYRLGKTKPTYTRTEASKPDEILTIALSPFGASYSATGVVNVAFSKRVSTEERANTAITAAHHLPAIQGIDRSRTFTPAKAVIRDFPTTDSETPETSQITGVKYTKRGVTTYTIPYGKGSANELESTVRAAIATAAKADQKFGANTKITFKSEQL